MKQRFGIKDIAQQLGISVSTVSRALRDAHDVNPATRKRVLALTEKLNFKNAFSKNEEANFPAFFEALKKGKLLTVDVLKNRKIDFKLANPAYLDVAVECFPKDESEEAIDDDMEEAIMITE